MCVGYVCVSFALNGLFTDHILPNVLQTTNVSVIVCAKLCVDRPTCKSLFHSSLDNRCYLVDTLVKSTRDLMPMVGMKYYSKPLTKTFKHNKREMKPMVDTNGHNKPLQLMISDIQDKQEVIPTNDTNVHSKTLQKTFIQNKQEVIPTAGTNSYSKPLQIAESFIQDKQKVVPTVVTNDYSKTLQKALKQDKREEILTVSTNDYSKSLQEALIQNTRGVISTAGMNDYSKPVQACSVSGYIYVAEGNFCYKDFLMEKRDWEDAKTFCKENGGKLIRADTELKHQFIVMKGRDNGYKNQWIGGYKDRRWKWLDGTRIRKTYWRKSGTDFWPWSNRIQYCWCDGAYSWDDAKGSHVKCGFLCEAPVS